jgi:F0F1-type ATP synthase assembly protein I
MAKSNKQKAAFALQALALVSELGFAIAVPIVLGVLVGIYVDKWGHGHGLILIAFILAGIVGGIFSAYKILAKMIRPD